MAQFFKYQTNREVAEGRKKAQYHPYADFDDFITEMPGARMRSLSDIRQSIQQLSKQMRERIQSLSSEGPDTQPQWLDHKTTSAPTLVMEGISALNPQP